MKKHLLPLLTAVLALSLVSCNKNGVNIDTPTTDDDVVDIDFSKFAILGDLGEWAEEVAIRTNGATSSVDDDCDVIFTDMDELKGQAKSIFEACDSGAVVIVFDPDFKELGKWASDYTSLFSVDPDAENNALFFAFSNEGCYIANEPAYYQGAVEDSLGNIITPEYYGSDDEILYDLEMNLIAEWLNELLIDDSSTKADEEKKKEDKMPDSYKQKLTGSQTVSYRHRVKQLFGYDDEVWTKGYITFSYNYMVTPMFGLLSGDQGYDYYFVTATFDNSFADVPKGVEHNLSKEFNESDAKSNGGVCMTYNYDTVDKEYHKDYHGGDINNYIFQVTHSLTDLHISGPMQKEFGFSATLMPEGEKMDNTVSFASDGYPIPESEKGKTSYQFSKTYSFGANLSIGGWYDGDKKDGVKAWDKNGGISGDLGFDWSNYETTSYSYDLTDLEIGRTGSSGIAGWRQRFNNLPTAEGANGFNMLPIKNIALSNGEQKCSWVWQVANTKEGDQSIIGKIKTDMYVNVRTVCNARAYSVEDNVWPVEASMTSPVSLIPARRVANGQVIIKNESSYTAENICFVSESTKESLKVTLQNSPQSAFINSGNVLHVNIPRGCYNIQYDLYKDGAKQKSGVLEKMTVNYAEESLMVIRDN